MYRWLFSARATLAACFLFLCLGLFFVVQAQPPGFGPPGFGPPGMGPGGPGGADRKLLEQFDFDKSGWLNLDERKGARAFVKENPAQQRGFGGPGDGPDGRGFGPPNGDRPRREGDGPGGFGPGGFRPGGFGGPGGGGPPGMGAARPEATTGATVDKSSVEPLQAELYDNSVLRTIFIDFEESDWEKELEEFHGTDVDVAATLTVDGKTYENCGIHFRGMSSYGMVPAGYKRSLNVSMDMADEDQRLLGFKTLNLLNGASDESMMSSVLYSHIARQFMPAMKANFVRVVINGENWGVYSNVQQFNKEFLEENYKTDKGARWKVSGSPRGGGGLDYRGEDPAKYGHPYEQKSGGKKATAKLIELCRVLDQTPVDALPAALEPIADVDELLWFLALDNALINSDGYWVRASDYNICLDENDKFHFIAHDMNEAFRGAGGPGGPGGPGGGRGGPGFGGPGFGERGPGDRERQDRRSQGGGEPQRDRPMNASSPLELDPLVGMDDASKPLRSKVLAVPVYREKYLAHVRTIAESSLDWNKISPFIASQVSLIDDAIKTETRKLGSYEAFTAATRPQANGVHAEQRGGHGSMNLKQFMDGRRTYLLK